MAQGDELRILFVCTANVCRSPLAAAFLARHLAAGEHDVRVSSASVHDTTRTRHPMTMALVAETGWSISADSKRLSEPLTDWADLILTMTGQHALAVAGSYRSARRKVFMLDHFVQIATPRSRGEPLHAWLDALWAQPRSYPTQAGARDVADPMGQSDKFYREIAGQIDELTERVAAAVRPPLNKD